MPECDLSGNCCVRKSIPHEQEDSDIQLIYLIYARINTHLLPPPWLPYP